MKNDERIALIIACIIIGILFLGVWIAFMWTVVDVAKLGK